MLGARGVTSLLVARVSPGPPLLLQPWCVRRTSRRPVALALPALEILLTECEVA
jgi:hypothetical protein